MAKPLVGVIDYGMGNLHSVSKALSSQGAKVTVSDSRARLKNSQLLVLPGVGSFGAASKTLSKKKLDNFVRSWIDDDKPYLGICLGFQLLFENSEEDPGIPGLGIMKGKVKRFRFASGNKKLKVPHMGWNNAKPIKSNGANFLMGNSPKDYFYFVHTFFPEPKDKKNICTKTKYGKEFCSSVARGNLFASQFHPEKSGKVGLKLLNTILKKAKAS